MGEWKKCKTLWWWKTLVKSIWRGYRKLATVQWRTIFVSFVWCSGFLCPSVGLCRPSYWRNTDILERELLMLNEDTSQLNILYAITPENNNEEGPKTSNCDNHTHSRLAANCSSSLSKDILFIFTIFQYQRERINGKWAFKLAIVLLMPLHYRRPWSNAVLNVFIWCGFWEPSALLSPQQVLSSLLRECSSSLIYKPFN